MILSARLDVTSVKSTHSDAERVEFIMHDRPTITIGVPVFQAERYLTDTLLSLTNQTFTDIEIIISDNASTDGTERICREFAARDPRIRYYRNDVNRGAAFNYNQLVDYARAPYFKWAAADDLCAPEYIERCIKLLESRNDVVLAYPKTTLIDGEGAVTGRYEDNLHVVQERAVDRFRHFFPAIRECNAVFGVCRTEALLQTPRIGDYIGSDVVLLCTLVLLGKVVEIPEYLFFRRDHSSASSADKSDAAQLEFFNPNRPKYVPMRVTRHYWEYFQAIRRAPISITDKWELSAFLFRSAISDRSSISRELWNKILDIGFGTRR